MQPVAQPARSVPESFAGIFREHAPLVWRALRRLGIAESDAEDLSQEVFMVVHRKLPAFEGRSTLRTWIYGITVRVAADHRKRAHVRRERPTDRVPEGRHSAPQIRALEREQARALLDRALETLDADKRAVFVLYEIEELDMPEVAEALNCALQTAYSRLYAARKLVTTEMTRLVHGDGADP